MRIPSTARIPNGGRSPHDDFLTLLPIVERHARIVFRDLDDEAREEAAAEVVAAAFEAHVLLKARGRNPVGFPSSFATYSVLRVKDGRHVGGRSSSRDVLSRKAQQRRGFRVESLPASTRTAFESLYAQGQGQQQQGTLEERLRDNTQTPVPEQVAFRLDFPVFLQALTARDRQMALALAEGHAAKQVADRFGLTPSRVTQLRQQWQQWQREWLVFQGETEQLPPAPRPD
jgi:hypothetical protein